MKYSQSEKMEIIRMVEESNLSMKKTLEKIDVPRSSFYSWYKRYLESGYEGLALRGKRRRQFWNAIPEWEKERVVKAARQYPEKSCREIAWRLCQTMTAGDVKETLDIAIAKTGVKHVHVLQKPKLLSDNGSAFIASELEKYLNEQKMRHIRSKIYHPMTQGKIERYFRSMKNLILLDLYYSPEELRARIGEWVNYYNNHRYHEAIDNVTPSDKYFGRDREILEQRKKIKAETMRQRGKWNQKMALIEGIN
jgi:transposase-like protein